MFKVVVFDHDNTREEFTSDPREDDDEFETPFTTIEQAREFVTDVLYEGAVAAMIVRMVREESHIGEIMEFVFNTEK